MLDLIPEIFVNMPGVSRAENEMAVAWPCSAADVTFFLCSVVQCCAADASGFWILVPWL